MIINLKQSDMGVVNEEEEGSGSKKEVHLVLGLGLSSGSAEASVRAGKKKKKVDDGLSLSLVSEASLRSSEEMRSNSPQSVVSDYCTIQQQHRKKLRLTTHQSALLEDCFKQHTTLNPKQKQALAKQLNLRPRQVEVWFQNRRARTKLKQTEVDCEFLKKCCETLTNENRRLQKEVQELKMGQGLYTAATLSICPSCQTRPSDNPPHLYNPFINPSAAC